MHVERLMHPAGLQGIRCGQVVRTSSGSRSKSVCRLDGFAPIASVGSKGHSYHNALAETNNGLCKSELIYHQSLKSREAVDLATLKWLHWYKHQRLLSSIGYFRPRMLRKTSTATSKSGYGGLT